MNTRKKVIKTVYRDEESENEDFSESASEAEIPDQSSDEGSSSAADSGHEFAESSSQKKLNRSSCGSHGRKETVTVRKKQFAKRLLSRLAQSEVRDEEVPEEPTFSVKNLTEEDKLLPAVLNLSESDSSEDESPATKKTYKTWIQQSVNQQLDDGDDQPTNYTTDWSKNTDESEEVAKKSFEQLQRHTDLLQEAKTTLEQYRCVSKEPQCMANVQDLLALGEEEIEKNLKRGGSSGSEMEDWEEVKDSKPLPQSGIQLVVDFPDASCKKTKQIDVEMMMRRKINRVKKEYQVYMHKVHVLCWLGHGNYINKVLNDDEVMAAALTLLPSEKSYPSGRVDTAYIIQISKWYNEKMKLVQDKNENKFKPNAPSLKTTLLKQIKSRVVTSKKMLVFIFVSLLRALGIQSRVVMNFVTLPIRPPNSELCSLATKHKLQPDDKQKPTPATKKSSTRKKQSKIAQCDGAWDSTSSMECSDTDDESITQLDGNNDTDIEKPKRVTRTNKLSLKTKETKMAVTSEDEGESPPKRQKQKEANKNQGSSKGKPAVSGKHSEPKTEDSKRKSPSRDVNKQLEDQAKPLDKTVQEAKISPNTKSVPKRSINKTPLCKENNNVKENAKEANIRNNENNTKSPMAANRITKLAPKRGRSKSTNIKEDNDNLQKNMKEVSDTPSISEIGSQRRSKSEIGKVEQKQNNAKGSCEKNYLTRPVRNRSRSKTPKVEVNNVILQKNDKEDSVTNKSKNAKTSRIQIMENTTTKTDKRSKSKKEKVSSEFFHEPSTSKSSTVLIPKIQLNSVDVIEIATKTNKLSLARKRGRTSSPSTEKSKRLNPPFQEDVPSKKLNRPRTKSAPVKSSPTSKYFDKKSDSSTTVQIKEEDSKRVSHRDLLGKSPPKKPKMDIKHDLKELIKDRVREVKTKNKPVKVKGKNQEESDDSDYLPEEPKRRASSENEFKPKKTTLNRKPLDRRVLSSDDDTTKKKYGLDVWCEVFVEEEEQWIPVDVVKPQVHCAEAIYSQATHPVAYVVGWDNMNRIKDVTRRYVPHYNTTTRKQRAESPWWDTAVRPWLGEQTIRDREEDEQLNKIMFDAPLPKSIAEYKNHPLYALQRHLLKFEALYPPDAPTLGFVRGEAVYPRACVHTCRSRDTWLKEAKTVKMGEKPYKVVKARPKWDKLSNRVITDIPLEVFGPWQVQDYEPPTAENGQVPRNAYGNVELFKDCMLPKGTVHIKLPGLNKVARKLNIDCAPAMTGFDFHGGWTHPVFDGFVVCEEFQDIITDAWYKDQEEMEKREREKTEARVYGNWKKLIKALLIRERLQQKYAFEDPNATKKKHKGPRLVVKKK